MTLEEANELVYVDNIDVSDIYIEPPDAGILTDEDSGDEDGGGLLDNLTVPQLPPKAEVILRRNEIMIGDSNISTRDRNVENEETFIEIHGHENADVIYDRRHILD